MTTKIPKADIDNFVRLYAAGKSALEIARECGYGPGAVRLRLIARGVEMRPAMPYTRIDPDIEKIIRMYSEGGSIFGISEKTGKCRRYIAKQLAAAGVELRTHQEAIVERNKRMTPEQIQSMTEAAHAAIRGVKRPEEELRRKAITRQKTMQYVGGGEMLFARWLNERGYETAFQVPEGRYNIDIAVGRVAVEIHVAARNPIMTPQIRKRVEYLLNVGWDIVYVWISHSYFLTEGACEDVVAFLQSCQSNESARRRYRVIRGTGKLVAEGGADGDRLT